MSHLEKTVNLTMNWQTFCANYNPIKQLGGKK